MLIRGIAIRPENGRRPLTVAAESGEVRCMAREYSPARPAPVNRVGAYVRFQGAATRPASGDGARPTRNPTFLRAVPGLAHDLVAARDAAEAPGDGRLPGRKRLNRRL